MSRTDHHRRNRGRFAPSRYSEGHRVRGKYHWRNLRNVALDEQEPIQEQITAQISAVLDEGMPMVPPNYTPTECSDVLDEPIDEPFDRPEAAHLGAMSSNEHLRECASCCQAYATTVTPPRWLGRRDPEVEAAREADLADLMGDTAVVLGKHRRGPWRWDGTKCERKRVWDVARTLGISAAAAVRLLRVGLNEYVTGPQATIPAPVIRELIALVETRRDECEVLLADVPHAWEPTKRSAMALLLAEEDRRIALIRERLMASR